MAEHYDVYLKLPVSLPEGTIYSGAYNDEHDTTMLSFDDVQWTKTGSDAEGMSFSDTDRSVTIPKHNILLVEVWDD